jgi:hypothetical protein
LALILLHSMPAAADRHVVAQEKANPIPAPAGMTANEEYYVTLDSTRHTATYKGEVPTEAKLPAHPDLEDEYWVNVPGAARAFAAPVNSRPAPRGESPEFAQ